MRKARGRRRYFVQRGLQGRFIATFAALALAGAVATGVLTGLGAQRTLEEAMFRAHFVERSTGDLVFPVLLEVNAVAAGVLTVCALLAALWLFRRQARTLDAVCAGLAAWQQAVASGGGGTAPSTVEEHPGPASPGWAAGIEDAVCEADHALSATYRLASERAGRLAATADRIEQAAGRAPQEESLAGELDGLHGEAEEIRALLARYAEADAE